MPFAAAAEVTTMGYIITQYRAVVTWTIGLVATAQVLMVLIVLPALPRRLQDVFQAVGNPSMAFMGVAAIWIYEKLAWRIVNPWCDFAGEWDVFDTFYAKKSAGVERKDRITFGTVQIKQSPWTICIAEGSTRVADGNDDAGGGRDYSTWWRSLSCELTDDGSTIHASLKLDRSYVDRPNAPSATHAYEMMEVKKRDEFGRPVEMLGKTFHCIAPNETAWIGQSVYTRKWSKTRFQLLMRLVSTRRPEVSA